MNMQKPLKCAAAVIAAVILSMNTVGIVTAETTLSETEAEVITVPAAAETTEAAEEETESEETEWWKAEITDYDSSLSLISYELTPEITQTEDETEEETEESEEETTEEAEDTADADDAQTEDEAEEETTEAPTEPKAPTPVESQTSGAQVGEIPQPQQTPTINAQSGEFVFVTNGWGHCVGMSQNGANFYAMYSGWTYQDILYHYYPGTYLMNTGTAQSETVTSAGVSGDVLSTVAGIVYREVGSSMHTETIKAQAVAVYTYIKYYGDDSRDLRCKANPPQNVIDACASVLGEALYYNGKYALTVFSASTGGASANCYDVFSNDIPYLRSVPSEYDAAYDPHYGTVKTMSSSEVKRLVEGRYGVSLSDNPANWFQLTYGDGGYVSSVLLDGQKYVDGYDLKICLGLKSSNFQVSYQQ